MKKLFALLLAAAMILSMAACGSGTSSGNNATTPNETNGEAVATDGTANDPTALNLSGKSWSSVPRQRLRACMCMLLRNWDCLRMPVWM